MENNTDFDVIIIGGGIVGLASAYKIASNHPGVHIAVLEKEDKLASHQTGRNSGVIHSGLYYKPSSEKAKTCIKGRGELVEFAKKHRIPYEICGKIIVATAEKELPRLEILFENGQQNGIEGLEQIGPQQIQKIEPACRGIAGLYVPCTGIIDYVKVVEKLAELVIQTGSGNTVLTGCEVTGFDRNDSCATVLTKQKSYTTKFIINCAGLQSDRIARADGVALTARIVPFRGDYYQLTKSSCEKVRNLIYPVPDPTFPFLGVHFTRMVKGDVECGPNAVFSFKREGYKKTDFNLADTWDALSYGGTRKLFIKNLRYGLNEYARAFSKRLFLHNLQRLIPSVTMEDIMPCRAGVRAQAVAPDGNLVDDFLIERYNNSIHVLNAPSPAATACLAIGDYISRIATEYFRLK
jgi:(S)-2-hydroxyglutarate dehydrogenase